jgi:hypothetical protein
VSAIDPFGQIRGRSTTPGERVAQRDDPVIRAKALQNRRKEPWSQPDLPPWRDRFSLLLNRCAQRFRKRRRQ